MSGGERRRAAWLDRLVESTDGPVRVQLGPEIQVGFPVEVFDEHGPGFVPAGALGLSLELEGDLVAWLRWWQAHVTAIGDEVGSGDEAAWDRWTRDGDALRERLQAELGTGFRVRQA